MNRVDLAREIFEKLRGSEELDATLTLMIGRSRSVERDRIVEELAPFRTDAKARPQARPLIVVATQCLEVGVDLDLDGLVTQAAPLDALRQRFGRLNRAGRRVPAEGAILAIAEDIAATADDPVYGDRIRLTWQALQQLAEGAMVDFGFETLRKRLEDVGIDQGALAAKRLDAPVLMPAYLDLWSQTSPLPAADPDIGLFLHGAERTLAGVSIVWRGDMVEDDLKDPGRVDLDELVRLVPPRATEAVDVPLWAARAWLRTDPRVPAISDAPEREPEAPRESANRREGRRVFRWAGSGDPRTGVVQPDEMHTGDMVVVPADYGGCDEFGWAPHSNQRVADVAHAAAQPYWGRRCAIRITRDIVQNDRQWNRLSAVLADESLDGAQMVEPLLDALPPVGTAEASEEENARSLPRDARPSLEALRRPRARRIDVHFPYAGGRVGGAILVAERGVEDADATDDVAPSTEDDNLSHRSRSPVPLEEHSRRVERIAERFARTLGVADPVAHDIGLAAFLHDLGKADRRFQTMLSGGNPWNRPDGPVLAKSGRFRSRSAWERSGLPPGWRHEALSVRMAQAHPRFAGARDPALVLWLIGSHHGLGRPFFGFLDPAAEHTPIACLEVADWQLAADDPGPQSLAFDLDGCDWPSVFEALKRRHGIWGLAHLEAILRLADHRASKEEDA